MKFWKWTNGPKNMSWGLRFRTLPHRIEDAISKRRGRPEGGPFTALAVGFEWVKRPILCRLFPDENFAFLPFGNDWKRDDFIRRTAVSRYYVWGDRGRDLVLGDTEDATIIRIEDGFLRSSGLGAAGAMGHSWTIDQMGVHFDPRHLSELELSLESRPICNVKEVSAVIEKLMAGRVSKYILPHNLDVALPQDAVLVIGQVEGDASIRACPAGWQTNRALVETAISKYGAKRIWFKPHPDVAAGLRERTSDPETILPTSRIIGPSCTLPSLLLQKPIVLTISSLSGFEALWHRCEVHTFGGPFYAGWGLTQDALNFPRRTATLSLHQIFFLSLFLIA